MKDKSNREHYFESKEFLSSYNCYFCLFTWISFSLALLSYMNIKALLKEENFPQINTNQNVQPISNIIALRNTIQCPESSKPLLTYYFSGSNEGCLCNNSFVNFPCSTIYSHCQKIQPQSAAIFNQWPFDSNQIIEPILFCAYHMPNNYSFYKCNETNKKQCSTTFCVPLSLECPIKGVHFSEGGIGDQVNEKWNFQLFRLSGFNDPSEPLMSFDVQESKQGQYIEKKQFFTVNEHFLTEENILIKLIQVPFVHLRNGCEIPNLSSGLWSVEQTQLFVVVSLGAFAGIFGGLIQIITTCSLIGCNLECMLLEDKHPSYVGIIKIWIFLKYIGQIVCLVAIISCIAYETQFLSNLEEFIQNQCSTASVNNEIEEFIGIFKKQIYYFLMVDLILYVGTFTGDIVFGVKIWLSKNQLIVSLKAPGLEPIKSLNTLVNTIEQKRTKVDAMLSPINFKNQIQFQKCEKQEIEIESSKSEQFNQQYQQKQNNSQQSSYPDNKQEYNPNYESKNLRLSTVENQFEKMNLFSPENFIDFNDNNFTLNEDQADPDIQLQKKYFLQF